MEASKEAISLRVSRLNSQLLTKNITSNVGLKALSRDTLLDALTVLYDECNIEALKRNDKHIATFLDKYYSTISDLKKTRVNISDFEVKNTIGRGHFGQVNVVKEKQTGDVYAMKTMRKSDSLKVQALSYEEERNIMSLSNSPWLTSLQYAFQDASHLYLVMEFHSGGELYGLLERQGGKLSAAHSIFYLSELIQAIHSLHSMGYVHRDVKPENILLDRLGHLKLADFGSAAKLGPDNVVMDKDGISIGTANYVAIEVLKANEKPKFSKITYGCGCDYWSVGVIAYELAIGCTPFTSTTVAETFNKIMNFSAYLNIPADPNVSPEYVDFIFQLVTDQNSRLSYEQILDHVLFKETDWTSLREQVPPFIPKVSSADDASNFSDPDVSNSCPSIENFITRSQFSGRNLPFIGFSYTNGITSKQLCEIVSPSKKLEEKMLEKKKKQVESLSNQLALAEYSRTEYGKIDYEILEQKLEDYARKIENVENVRNKLEKQLGASNSETMALKRTIEVERLERQDLETRALQLIRSAKLKWEVKEKERVDRLNEHVDIQLAHITDLCTANNTLTSKLQRCQKQLDEAHGEIKKLQNLATEHKESLTKVCELNRQSKTSAELQAERSQSKNESRITELETKISLVCQSKNKIVQELENSQKRVKSLEIQHETCIQNCNNLKTKLQTSMEDCEQLRRENSDLRNNLKSNNDRLSTDRENYKSDNDKLKNDNLKLEETLEQERKECQLLRTEVKDLTQAHENELNMQINVRERLKLTYDLEIQHVEEKLTDAFKQIEELNKLLEESNRKEIETDIKVEKLESLLERLESGVTKWEASNQRESYLQEQIEHLTSQIKELHETGAVAKQEHRSAMTKLWRTEKELSNCNMDKRIVERHLKQAEDKMKTLNDEIKNFYEQTTEMQSKHDQEIIKVGENMKAVEEKYQNMITAMKNLEAEVEMCKTKYEEERSNVSQITKKLNTAIEESNALQIRLTNEMASKSKLCKEIENMQENNIKLHYNMDVSRQVADRAKSELEKHKTELQDILTSNNALKEACFMLDRQLKLCERIIAKQEERDKQYENDIRELKVELENASAEVKKHSGIIDEERAVKMQVEMRCEQIEENVSCLEADCNSYKSQVTEYKDVLSQVCKELSTLDKEYGDLKASDAKLKRVVADLKTELTCFKKECSTRLTTIHMLRESNYKLIQEVKSYKDDKEILESMVVEQDLHIKEQNSYYKERETKAEATMMQQKKLIDFLQSKLTDKKKKKNKLFGNHKKENIAPTDTLYYRDIEVNKPFKRSLFPSMKKKPLTEHSPNVPDLQPIKSSEKLPFSRTISTNPHRFATQTCKTSLKCASCSKTIEVNSDKSVCSKCETAVHIQCLKAMANMWCPSKESNTDGNEDGQTSALEPTIRIESWIKLQMRGSNSGWHLKYARLEDTVLAIYDQNPSEDTPAIIRTELCPDDGWSSASKDVLAEEVGSTTSAELPLLFRIDLNSRTTCWPAKPYFIMATNENDKEMWLLALNKLFLQRYPDVSRKNYKVVFKLQKKLEPICIQELSKEIFLLGCEEGLYASEVGNPLLHISGPECVDEIRIIKSINLVLMILGKNRNLVKTPLVNLASLVHCAPCTNPTLKYTLINDADGFHLFEVYEYKKHHYICAATNRHLFLFKYDFRTCDFNLLRKLDTAEPVSCILFKDQSIIVGADKFFKIDLKTFAADEFLNTSDRNLREVLECYKRDSFPLGIILLNTDPCEYLLCFNECGIFVDEFGRRSRDADFKWSHMPVMFAYCAPFLYVTEFTAVEIIRFTPEMGKNVNAQNWINGESKRLDFRIPRYLGQSTTGIYLSSENEVIHINAKVIIDDESEDDSEGDMSDTGTEFSFTSSIISSLDRVTIENK